VATTQTTPEELVTRLSDPAGFKKMWGFLGGKRAKAAHALFTGADAKGVARSYTLDTREHEGTGYYLKAIGTRGDLTGDQLNELTRAAKLLPLGTVRYEGMMAPTMPEFLGSSDDANDVHSLSRLDEGIIVYPVTVLNKKREVTFAAWAHQGDQWSVYPIEDNKL
jgi:hypothetical protein